MRLWILRSLGLGALLLAACSGRAVLGGDGGHEGRVSPTDSWLGIDQWRLPDRGLPLLPDAGRCGPELRLGLVSTFFEGEPSTTLTRTVAGAVDYHGPVTNPLATSPLFDREIQIAGEIIQYHLPAGIQLPLAVKPEALYTFTVKRRLVPGQAFTEALIIKGNVPGPWPFALIAEPATYGQALDPADPLIAPLKVMLRESEACPTSPAASCAPVYVDRLRFEASTGAGLIAAELGQGEVISLTMFGQKMTVANLASQHQRPACPGGTEQRWSYLLVEQ